MIIRVNGIKVSPKSIIPENWFKDDCVEVLMKVFKIDELQEEHLSNYKLELTLNYFHIFVFRGEIISHQVTNPTDLKGDFLIIILNKENRTNHDFELKYFSGLLSGLVGINVTRKFLFNYPFKVCGKQTLAFFTNEHIWRHGKINGPNLSVNNLGLISSCIQSIEGKDEKSKEKIRNSLFWFSEAQAEIGTIAFLKYWIAIESLVKDPVVETKIRYCLFFTRIEKEPASTIASISKRLQKIYDMSNPKIRKIYQLRKLARLRALIAHHGSSPNLTHFLLKSCEMLYVDLLSYEVMEKKTSYSLPFFTDKKLNFKKLIDDAV